MNPVVFLDIDGVLHLVGDKPGTFRTGCVEALNWLTETARADIVISSTWRFRPDIREVLRAEGVTGDVIGMTPSVPNEIRGIEIKVWLAARAPRRYVILDDDRDMGTMTDRLVQTDSRQGLTFAKAERALKVLRRRLPAREVGA